MHITSNVRRRKDVMLPWINIYSKPNERTNCSPLEERSRHEKTKPMPLCMSQWQSTTVKIHTI